MDIKFLPRGRVLHHLVEPPIETILFLVRDYVPLRYESIMDLFAKR